MTNLELYKIMRQVVLMATNCPVVIKENPNAPSPDGEYCAISATQAKNQRGQANIKRKNTDEVSSPIGDVVNVNHDVRSQIVADISINFYRGDAHDYAMDLLQANKLPNVQEFLFTNKVGWNSAGPINNLDFLQSENWESRAQLTIKVMYEHKT